LRRFHFEDLEYIRYEVRVTNERLFWFSLNLRREESAEGEIPSCEWGFSRHGDLSPDWLWAA
jgi:hypothetical protein